jgi:iron complex outermembrane recepter protein
VNIYSHRCTRGRSVNSWQSWGRAQIKKKWIGLIQTNHNRYCRFKIPFTNTPSNTEAFGLTYQQKHFDFGIFDKRVGPMWNDLTLSNNLVANQIIPINPFTVTNVYLDYMVIRASRWDATRFRLSVNNVFNQRGIVGVQQAANTYTSQATAVYNPRPADQLVLLPGRSITLTISPGFSPKGR